MSLSLFRFCFFFCCYYYYYYSFGVSLSLLVLSSLSLLGFLELAAPWQRFSIPIGVVNVLVDINLHPLLGADDVSGNVVVGGQYQTFCR